MNAYLNRFLATGGGPSRFRRELQEKTQPIRQVLRATQTVHTPAARLPESVFGGDLLALMSRPLRQILDLREETEAAISEIRERSPVFPGRAFSPFASRRGDLPESPSAREGRAASRFSALPGAETPETPFSPLPDEESRMRRAYPTEDTGETRDASPFSALPEAANRALQPDAPGANNGNASPPAREMPFGDSALAAQLREYWEQARQQEESRSQSADSAEKTGASSHLASLPPIALPGSRSALQSWAEGMAEQPGRPAGLPLGQSASGAVRNGGWSAPALERFERPPLLPGESTDAVRQAEDAEIAERLADILREQAQRRGIDLT